MTDPNKRNSDFSYGHVYQRSSDLNDVGNPTVTAGSQGRSPQNRLESLLSRDRTTIEDCVTLLDNSQEHNILLTWLCSHKLETFVFIAHMMLSVIIWQHYFLEKYHANVDSVGEGVNKYYVKLTLPAFLYGIMHVLLFQMALLPLTMCRVSLSYLNQTSFKKVLPLNNILAVHIYLGYLVVGLSLMVTITYLAYYGILCEDEGTGDDNNADGTNYCYKVSTEIFLTGIAMMVLLFLIGSVSLVRDLIPYEVFRYVHHLTLVVYGLAVLHTIDFQVRSNNLKRSQSYKWFAATLTLYLTERIYMWSLQKRLPVHAAVALDTATKAVTLTLNKPVTFGYLPGQYAFLRIASIDGTWHPFTIISTNKEDYLEFYVEVKAPGSWSHTLFDKVKARTSGKHTFHVDVIGPFGNAVIDTKASHLCLVGSDNGILPLLSAYKFIVHKWLEIDANTFLTTERKKRDRAKLLVTNQKFIAKSLRGALYRLGPRDTRGNPLLRASNDFDEEVEPIAIDEVRHRIKKRLRFEAAKAVLIFAPLFELTVCGLLVSWSFVDKPTTLGMAQLLRVSTAINTGTFGLLWLVTFDLNHFSSWIDMLLVVTSAIAIAMWNSDYRHFSQGQVIAYIVLSVYRVIRGWVMATRSNYDVHRSFIDGLGLDSVVQISSLKLIWIIRDPRSAIHIWKQIDDAFVLLEKTWGECAQKVLKIEIHTIDNDDDSLLALKDAVSETALYRSGALLIGKLKVYHTVERLLTKRIEDDIAAGGTAAATSTHISYCGGASLGSMLARIVAHIQVIAYSMKHGHHHITYSQEQYGSFDVLHNQGKREQPVDRSNIALKSTLSPIEAPFKSNDLMSKSRLFAGGNFAPKARTTGDESFDQDFENAFNPPSGTVELSQVDEVEAPNDSAELPQTEDAHISVKVDDLCEETGLLDTAVVSTDNAMESFDAV